MEKKMQQAIRGKSAAKLNEKLTFAYCVLVSSLEIIFAGQEIAAIIEADLIADIAAFFEIEIELVVVVVSVVDWELSRCLVVSLAFLHSCIFLFSSLLLWHHSSSILLHCGI